MGSNRHPELGISRLDTYLIQQGFKKGMVDSNLYIRTEKESQLVVVVYVDDIIFGGSRDEMCKTFTNRMQT